jgi:ATP phosphoribosyltransferase regulatory subunit
MALFEALQRKAVAEISALIEQFDIPAAVGDMLLALADLNGDDALDRAERCLAGADVQVRAALARLRSVAEETRRWLPGLPVHFDLAELRGYTYKTGVVFAAFVPGWGMEIGRGGRYDDIGRVFGRARPAVGFSTDLKGLISLAGVAPGREDVADAVLAPWDDDADLQASVQRLRAAGRRVIQHLPGQPMDLATLGCSETLERIGGAWQLRRLLPEGAGD